MTTEQIKSFEEEQLSKINEQMAKLAAKKRKIRELQKKKDEKKRRSTIFAIGEFFEHLEILDMDKNIILGALTELANEKDNQEKIDSLSLIGIEEMEKIEARKKKRESSTSSSEEV